MIKVYSLGSGSKGNCMLINDGNNSLLIDAGLSLTTTKKKLSEIGIDIKDISGILLTHEHRDHIAGLPKLSEYLLVYTHQDTINAMINGSSMVKIDNSDALHPIDKEFELDGFYITPFDTSHDAAHPLGFIIQTSKEKLAYMTDSGYVSEGAFMHMSGADTVVIESNHDEEMLLRGSYAPYLKKRVWSDRGHLRNTETALTVADLAKNGARRVMLAHLSENNNLPELAYWESFSKLKNIGVEQGDVLLKVASQIETVTLW